MANSVVSSKDYSQPDFYHFSEDSIHLSKYIIHQLSGQERGAEFGAGCGVVSCEILNHHPRLKLTLLELQEEFIPHMKVNLKSHTVKICHTDLRDFKTDDQFDFIFFNPPYFWEGSSRRSPMEQRNKCRLIEKNDWVIWLKKAKEFLSEKGRLFFCHRSKEMNAEDFGFFEEERKEFENCYVYSWRVGN